MKGLRKGVCSQSNRLSYAMIADIETSKELKKLGLKFTPQMYYKIRDSILPKVNNILFVNGTRKSSERDEFYRLYKKMLISRGLVKPPKSKKLAISAAWNLVAPQYGSPQPVIYEVMGPSIGNAINISFNATPANYLYDEYGNDPFPDMPMPTMHNN